MSPESNATCLARSANEATFKSTPSEKKKNGLASLAFPFGFLAGFFIAGFVFIVLLTLILVPFAKNWSVENPINKEQAKINFDLKFTDYAMHGEKELNEKLNQYCIKTNEPAKFNGYLKCFIESAAGDASCNN